MSREPSSGELRYWFTGGEPPPKPSPPPKANPLAKPQPPPSRRRVPRVRVEGVSAAERAVLKLATTTTALTAEERRIIRGYRLSVGGAAAEAAKREIEIEIEKGRRR